MTNEGGSAVHLLSIPPERWAALVGPLVYFAGPVDGPIKIGRAVNLARRMKEIKCAHPAPVHVWATTPGGSLEEALYHNLLATHRVHGEWFARHPDVLSAIERLQVPA